MTPRAAPSLSLLLALLLVGCGDDAESAAPPPDAAPADAAAPEQPWASIPADSLYGATATENLRVTRAVLDVARLPEGWEGLRIAVLSDFQLGLWEDNEEVAAAAVRRAIRANPGLIVLLGDYLGEGMDTAALGRVLDPLRGRPVLAVLGDRDIRSDSVEVAVKRTLAARGIQVLENSAVPFTYGGTTAPIVGLDPDLVDEPWGDQEWVLGTTGGGGGVPLLLTHYPALAARMPRGRYAAALAGNTFCGTIAVPGTPRLSWLRSESLPGAAVEGVERLFRIEGATMFVTCGLGYSFVPIRFGAPPELGLVTLRSAGAEGAAAPADTVVPDTLIERFQTAPADTAR